MSKEWIYNLDTTQFETKGTRGQSIEAGKNLYLKYNY